MSQDDIKYLLLAECDRRAAAAGIGYRKAGKAMRSGELTVFKVGGRYLVAESEFKRWLSEPGKVVVPSRSLPRNPRPPFRRITY